MENFKLLNTLPIFDLYTELQYLLQSNNIFWHKANDQICLNSTKDNPDDFLLGRGSLFYDWDKSSIIDGKINVPKRKKLYQEEDFVILCSAFKNTKFEIVYNSLSSQYKLGRIRIMKSFPKTCLSWHVDTSPRIHYPMKTQEGCFMVIENEVKHLEKNTWYWTNTTLPHTAFNASTEDRLHLVATILS